MEKKYTVIDSMVFLLCFFPYLTIIETPFDTQPYALLFCTILIGIRYVFNSRYKFPSVIGFYFLVFLYAMIHSFFFSSFSESIRSLMGYISVPIFMLSAYMGGTRVNPKILAWISSVWLFFGLVQTFIMRSFGQHFVSRMSTSLDRGVTGLAVEPSYYAILCIFILIFNSLFYQLNQYGSKRYYYIFFASTVQIVLAKSAMGFMLYIIYLIGIFIFSENAKIKLKQLGTLILLFIPSVFIMQQMKTSDSRIASLLVKLDSGLANLILKDGSISDRLSHILVSFSSLFHSKGIGFGLGKWNEHAFYISQNSGRVIKEISEVNFTLGRIMSGWGSVVFELGIVGVVFIGGFFYIILNKNQLINKKNKIAIFSTSFPIFVLMLTSVPLTYPLFGYFMGIILLLKNELIKVTINEK